MWTKFNYKFNFFNRYRAIQIIYFFLCVLFVGLSKDFSLSSIKLTDINLFIILHCYPFNICRICGNFTFTIPDIANFCLSCFTNKDCQLHILIFPEDWLLISSIFFSVFYVTDFCTEVYYFLSSVYLGSHWLFSSCFFFFKVEG